MQKRVPLLAASAALMMLAGCDDCEDGFKVKTEYRTIFQNDRWHESLKDTLLDGAMRITTWTLKDSRSLTIRCFRSRPDQGKPQYDLRYTIWAPLLSRIAPEIEKAGRVELVVSLDGTAIGLLEAQSIKHDDGISFLADLEPALVDRLAAAEKSIVVMPRQENERLDNVIEFGVADLKKHIEPVKAACAEAGQPEQTPRGTRETRAG